MAAAKRKLGQGALAREVMDAMDRPEGYHGRVDRAIRFLAREGRDPAEREPKEGVLP